MKFLTLFSLLALLTSCNFIDFHNAEKSTVMITNLDSNSGGSGTIIHHGPSESTVLTNRHICSVVKNGGLVITEKGNRYQVSSFIMSEEHDLCLIYVLSDLDYSSKVASRATYPYEAATVYGHPKLLPLIKTAGQFSGYRIINVVTDTKKCSPEEAQDPNSGLFCAVFGRLPVVRSFEAQVVSALIQPGSSGSGVYNSQGEIDAVVFAGSGDLGFAFTVPYEYVNFFLTKEIDTLKVQTPNNTTTYVSAQPSNTSELTEEKLEEVCSESNLTSVQKRICVLFINFVIGRNVR